MVTTISPERRGSAQVVGASRANIELADVRYAFGVNRALAGVDFQAGPGVLGLLGPNGAGKTTLLRVLATVLKPSDGQIRLLGRAPGDRREVREIRRRLGYLPQQFGYYPNFTVFEFIEYIALLKEMPTGDVRAGVARAIERVGLEERARTRLKTLSGGMLRRVGIAQAIVNDPQLLLLDEPTAGLDPEQRIGFRRLIREIGERSTVIVSTHLVEDVAAACARVMLMDGGRIVFDGTPDELALLGTGAGMEDGGSSIERGYGAVLGCAREKGVTR